MFAGTARPFPFGYLSKRASHIMPTTIDRDQEGLFVRLASSCCLLAAATQFSIPGQMAHANNNRGRSLSFVCLLEVDPNSPCSIHPAARAISHIRRCPGHFLFIRGPTKEYLRLVFCYYPTETKRLS